MNRDLVDILSCPQCRGALTLGATESSADRIESGALRCAGCGGQYPIVRSIPRFVPAENYAANFGFQWLRFRKTQLDSHSGVPITRNRFLAQSGWSAESLRGKRVLDVGCGAGRFAEVAHGTGARLVAIDYSAAVDACRENLGEHPTLDIVQADVYHLPFRDEAFDFVYCFGVIQHTPDPRAAFFSIPRLLCAGGRLAIDAYAKLPLNVLWPKYWLRPFTKRMPAATLFAFVQRLVHVLFPVSLAIGRIPLVGRKLRYAVPVVNYEGVYPLSGQQLREWAVLDTFDMLGPMHDHPQSIENLREWMTTAGLHDVEVVRIGQVVARGTR